MPIDKIGSTEPYTVVQRSIVRPKQLIQAAAQEGPIDDTISLTKAAQQNAEILRVRDLAMAAPDIRTEKIIELHKKLSDPSYPDQTIISNLAKLLLEYGKL